MTRLQNNWPEHDRVIEASAATWRRNPGNVVHTNPDGQKNFSVNENSFPDVVVTNSQNRLLAVEEVETADTVTEQEASQWREYAGFGVTFNLIVPVEKVSDARNLISDVTNVRIQGYVINSGGIQFV